MLLSQKLALRVSEIRQRLNLVAGLEGDDLTDEIRIRSGRARDRVRPSRDEVARRPLLPSRPAPTSSARSSTAKRPSSRSCARA